MSAERSERSGRRAGGDPWAAFGYLVAGVGFYGLLGWVLGRWLHASYLTPLGIVLGAAFAMYLTYRQYALVSAPSNTAVPDRSTSDRSTRTTAFPDTGSAAGPDTTVRPVADDR